MLHGSSHEKGSSHNTHEEVTDKEAAKKFVEDAKKEFNLDKEHWSKIYKKARDDLHFLSDEKGAQWPEKDFKSRNDSNRPALEMDKLGQMTRSVINKMLMNTPTINVNPSDSDADEETADIFKGLIRNIEYQSSADDAYDLAATNQVRSSIGFITVDHDYIDDFGLDQDLIIKRVNNHLNIYLDRNIKKPDGSDAGHGTELETISLAEFKERFKGFEAISFTCPKGETAERKKEKTVTIAQFYKIEFTERRVGVFKGLEGMQDVTDELIEEFGEPIKERMIKDKTVRRAWLSGEDILEETTFPGRYIPLIPVMGEEHWLDGKRHIHSLIRKAKTPQQMHNLWKSLETELLLKQPQAPWLVADGQIDDWQDEWEDPNNAFALRYKPVVDGVAVPAPQRQNPPVSPTGVLNASAGTLDDIRAAVGIHEASVGEQGNETSGIAIQRRRQEGEIGTFHYHNNLMKSIAHVGRILINAIPDIYDSERIIRIIGEEEAVSKIKINSEMQEGLDEAEGLPKGQKRTFDMTMGRYDVRVSTGAPFSTLREEAAERYTEVLNANPEMFQIIGDIAFDNMDFPGASAIAKRLRKLVDPKLLEGEDGEEEGNPEAQALQEQLEQAAADMQEMQQALDQITKQLEDKSQEIEVKAVAAIAKAETDKTKVEIDGFNADTDRENAETSRIKVVGELSLKEDEVEIKKAELAGNQISDHMDRVVDLAQDGLAPSPISGEFIATESSDDFVGE